MFHVLICPKVTREFGHSKVALHVLPQVAQSFSAGIVAPICDSILHSRTAANTSSLVMAKFAGHPGVDTLHTCMHPDIENATPSSHAAAAAGNVT
jgi:hypothetical protein